MRLLPLLVVSIALAALALSSSPPAGAQGDDWSVENSDARRREIVDRYRRILERRPVQGHVLDRLIEAVGGARGVARLVGEYEARLAEAPGDANLQLLLGHLRQYVGDYEGAIAAYDEALTLDPASLIGLRGKADALSGLGRPDEARAAYEAALAQAQHNDERQELLFALTDLALENRDFEAAVAYMAELVALDPSDVYMREELATTLLENRLYAEAIEQYAAIAQRAGGDTRQRALALGSIGDVLAEQGQLDEAIARYREAQGLTQRGSWIFDDLERRVIDAFRASGDVESLVSDYEERWARPDFDQMRILVELYEELGRGDDALAMARRAVAANRRSVDARLDLVRLLERQGDLAAVITEYEALVGLSDEPVHAFRLAEIHRQQGDEGAALAALAGLERSHARRPSVLAQLAERYVRWGYRDRAIGVLEDLTAQEPHVADHWVLLGDLLYMDGRRDEALEVWAGLPRQLDDPAEAAAVLGRVYASHGFIDEALEQYAASLAADPANAFRLGELALVYEQASRWEEALATWEQLASNAPEATDRADARGRIVALYDRLGVLGERARGLEERFTEGADPAVGYLLGRAYLEAGDLEDAELVFATLLERDEGDREALQALARIAVEQNRLREAIALYERLASVDSDAAREVDQTIIDLSLRLFDVDQAIEVANRVVDANRNDARSYANLARIYRRTRRLERAAAAYEEALRLDRRATDYGFELAEIYLALGRTFEAERQFRWVVTESRVESEILRAGGRALQLAQARDDARSVTLDWARLIFRAPLESVHRRLFLDAVGALTEPLLQTRRYGEEAARERAAAELAELANAVGGPLGAILSGADAELAAQAALLAGRLRFTEVPEALVGALHHASPEVRRAAAVALGWQAEAAPPEALMAALLDGSPEVRSAAAWALGEVGAEGALNPLLGLLQSGRTGAERAFAAWALGRLGSAAAVEGLVLALHDDDASVRQATLWALGALGDARSEEAVAGSLAEGGDGERRAAAWALGRLPASETGFETLLRAWWAESEAVRPDLGAALAAYGSRREVAGEPAAGAEPQVERLLEAQLAGALAAAPAHNGASGARWAGGFERVALEVLRGADELARERLLADLIGGAGPWPAAGGAWAGLAEAITPLLERPSARLRGLAAAALAQVGSGTEVVTALRAHLGEADATVRAEVAAALGRIGSPGEAQALAALLDDPDCRVRAAAAEAVGRLGGEVERVLEVAPEGACRLLWARAASGLAARGGGGLERLLAAVAREDAAVRLDVVASLAGADTPAARRGLEALGEDPDPAVRAAARAALAR